MVEYLHELLYVVLVTVVSVSAKYVISYFNSKRTVLEAESEHKLFEDTVISTIALIERVVDTVSQTYVDSLKKNAAFDKDKQKEALDKALEMAKNMIDEESTEILTGAYADLDAWLKVQIESYIRANKSKA